MRNYNWNGTTRKRHPQTFNERVAMSVLSRLEDRPCITFHSVRQDILNKAIEKTRQPYEVFDDSVPTDLDF